MPEVEKEQKLSVISFNAFGAPFYAQRVLRTMFSTHVYKRLAYLSEQLNLSDADVIALQEVNTYPQYLYLKSRLRNFPHVHFRKYVQGPRGGLVFFSKVPFESIDYITFDKSGSYRDKSFIADVLKRGLLIGKVANMPITIVNTHLTHNVSHDWSENGPVRSIHDAQLAQIIAYLHSHHLENTSAIVTGDFNIPKATELFDQFLRRSNLIDVFHEYTETTYHEEFTLRNTPLGRIDHIFLLRNGRQIEIANKYQMFEGKVTLKNGKEYYLSDHIGLYAQFRFSHR